MRARYSTMNQPGPKTIATDFLGTIGFNDLASAIMCQEEVLHSFVSMIVLTSSKNQGFDLFP